MRLAPTLRGFEPARRRWRAWARTEPALTGLDMALLRSELDEGGQHRCDELFAALVRVAHQDSDAQTVLIGCLWPGIAARAARYATPGDREDAVALLVTELVEDLASGCRAHLREFVATGLLEAPTGRLRRALRRQRVQTDVLGRNADVVDHAAVTGPSDLSAGTLLRLAVDAGAISGRAGWLIHATEVEGHSLSWAARQLGISYAAAAKRRQRAEAAWAQWWDPDRSRHDARPSRRAS